MSDFYVTVEPVVNNTVVVNETTNEVTVTETTNTIQVQSAGIQGPMGVTLHESMSDLLGGASNDHYHLTQSQHDDLTDGGDSTAHIHDSRYYTETESDVFFAGKENTGVAQSLLSAHIAASDPHPQYETSAEAQAKVDAHANLTNNPHAVTKAQVGLGNAENTSDSNKPVSTAQAAAIAVVQSDVDTHEADTSNPHSVTKAQVGLSNVPNIDTSNPSNITQDSTHRFATDAEKTLWNSKDAGGSASAAQAYAVQRVNHTGTQSVSTITGLSTVATSGAHSDLSGVGTNTHAQIDTHIANTSNPHAVTKAQVGLGSVDNTADIDKPISTATQTALDLKENLANKAVNFNTVDDTLYPSTKAAQEMAIAMALVLG